MPHIHLLLLALIYLGCAVRCKSRSHFMIASNEGLFQYLFRDLYTGRDLFHITWDGLRTFRVLSVIGRMEPILRLEASLCRNRGQEILLRIFEVFVVPGRGESSLFLGSTTVEIQRNVYNLDFNHDFEPPLQPLFTAKLADKVGTADGLPYDLGREYKSYTGSPTSSTSWELQRVRGHFTYDPRYGFVRIFDHGFARCEEIVGVVNLGDDETYIVDNRCSDYAAPYHVLVGFLAIDLSRNCGDLCLEHFEG